MMRYINTVMRSAVAAHTVVVIAIVVASATVSTSARQYTVQPFSFVLLLVR
jgi:hypothetical protein